MQSYLIALLACLLLSVKGQATGQDFTFSAKSRCFPASECDISSCTYDFRPGNSENTKDFGNVRCGHHTVFYSDLSVSVDQLPFGFKFTCDHPNNLHFGLMSRKNRNWNVRTWDIEIANVECQASNVKLWSNGKKDFTSTTNDEIVIWIRKDRQIEYYNNGVFMTYGDIIAESQFPVDFAISPPDNNHHGYLRNIGYVSGKPQEKTVVAVELSANALQIVTDIGEKAFNEKFKACPVVQYNRNGAVHSIYKRITPIPENFNAYKIFTDTWKNTPVNTMGTDFEIFSSVDDLLNDQNQWTFCNYNDPDVAYPRDCGRYGYVPNQWFSMPGGIFNARGVSNGAGFTLFNECPIDFECQEENESSLDQNNFNDRGDSNLNWQSTYSYTLSNGYLCTLSGWTHTRNYAKGFLTNQAGTNPTAKISGLTPNQQYKYQIYQYASSYAGTNGFTAPGASEIETTTHTNGESTASGTFISDSNGEALFQFRRIAHHVHLSGISIAATCGRGCPTETFCDADGFQLAMQFSSNSIFTFDSNYWTDETLLGRSGEGISNQDGKYKAFNEVRATEIRICAVSCVTLTLPASHSGQTLKEIFSSVTSGPAGLEFDSSKIEEFRAAFGAPASNYPYQKLKLNFDDTDSGYQCKGRLALIQNNEGNHVTANDAIGLGAQEAGGNGAGATIAIWPYHSTSLQAQLYVRGVVEAVLKECRWESNHDQNANSADYMGWTCANDEILTGFGLSADQHDVTKVQCCKVGGHSSIKPNTCTYVESNHERAKCGNGNDHMVFSGAYDRRVNANDAVTEILAGKCCEVECDASWCAGGEWGVDKNNCQVISTAGTNAQEVVCPTGTIMTEVEDGLAGNAHGVQKVASVTCCALDIVAPPTFAPSAAPSTARPTSAPSAAPTSMPSVAPTTVDDCLLSLLDLQLTGAAYLRGIDECLPGCRSTPQRRALESRLLSENNRRQ